jgi:hypothetical protein
MGTRFRIYADLPEPCWWVEVQGGDGKEGYVLRSSRAIVVGRQTGTIHYDGSAGDEGITGTIVLLIKPCHESA